MTRFRTLAVLPGALFGVTFLSFGLCFGAPPADSPLDATLARLDRASAEFKGLTADIRKVSHTDVVNIDNVESGTIAVKRMKPKDTRIRIDLKDPRQQIVTIGNAKLLVFSPPTNEAQEYDLGKNRGLVDQFMLLGFGSNSRELKNAYSVTLGGVDSINGEKAVRIDLEPKDKQILARVKKCELWISDKGWTVQQKLYTGGGDYLLSTYSHMSLNPMVAESAVKLDLPKGAKLTKLK
jgi:outer membrane lipoprotein-sorting protein